MSDDTYQLAQIIPIRHFVGRDWMIDDASDMIFRMPERDKIGIFGDGQYPWCIELEADIAPRNRHIREKIPFSAGVLGYLVQDAIL